MGTGSTGWDPPHCPNPNCNYFNAFSPEWPFVRKGFYVRQSRPYRIQRFTCRACHRHFSTQTFSTSYWQKRPELSAHMVLMVVGCMGNRQIARAVACSPSTVAHHIARLGRHCLLIQARELARISRLSEIVIDGFETFEWSQYFPFHHNVAVDVASGYFLYHTDSPLRRKGRMTTEQKALLAAVADTDGRPVFTLGEFAGGAGDIRDPMGHDEDRYRATRDEIHGCLTRSMDRLLALLH